MGKAVKFAVSMPEGKFNEIETIRLKEGLSRSKVIFEAVELWMKSRMMENQIRTYEEGYRNMPERLQDIKGWETASLVTFSDEGW